MSETQGRLVFVMKRASIKKRMATFLALAMAFPVFSLALNTCPEPTAASFRKVSLDASGTSMATPVDMGVATDGRVFFIEMSTGKVHEYKPPTTGSKVIGTIPNIYFSNQEGLIGIELDPGFVQNGYVYLVYARKVNNVGNTFLSRFSIVNDSLVLASEKILLSFARPENNNHSTGGMAFDAQGNLYLATGDNTADGVNSNFGAFDSRTLGNDASRTSANTNDLRGKILRIHPEANGTYTIPSANLWETLNLAVTDTGKVRKEIYAMGFRQPYRISVDKSTGRLFVGEVGADAKAAVTPSLGPIGYEELNLIKAPGFYGWPFFSINQPYTVVTYSGTTATTTTAVFDSLHPVNNSPNNTGLTNLPPAQKPLFWYTYGSTLAFPQIQTGTANTIIAGPTYNYDANLVSSIKFPPYYNGKLFFSDWSRGWMETAKLNAQGDLDSIKSFIGSNAFIKSNLSFDFGADGALYVLQWGTTSASTYNNTGELYRIEYTGTIDNFCYSATGIAGKVRDNRAAKLMMVLNPTFIELPEGFQGAEVLAMNGKRLMNFRRDGSQGALRFALPAHEGLVRIRYY